MRVLYLIGGSGGETRTAFRDRILAFVRDHLAPLADEAVVAVTEEPPPNRSVIPFRRDLVALVSLDGIADDAGWPESPAGFAGAHLSEVARPVVHERTWDLGTRSPGVGLLTLFRRRPGLPDEEFRSRWFDGHTPLTLQVHPNAGYVRNFVPSPFEPPNAAVGRRFEAWDGIVEEQYDPPSNLLRARRFFGGSAWRMVPTMIRVYRDVKGFIDYPSIKTWLTAEYRLKEPSGAAARG